jgi:hypothetical protein
LTQWNVWLLFCTCHIVGNARNGQAFV